MRNDTPPTGENRPNRTDLPRPGANSSTDSIDCSMRSPTPDACAETGAEFKRVLVVATDANLRDLVIELVEGPDVNVTFANAVPELQLLQQVHPNLIIVDIHSSGISIPSLIESIESLHDYVPLLLISDAQDRDTVFQAIEGGAYDFVEKPLDGRRLIYAIRRALEYEALLRLQRGQGSVIENAVDPRITKDVQTKDFLKGILDSSTLVSIVVSDWDQNVLFWNKGAENIFGYTAEEMIGNKITRLYDSDAPTATMVRQMRKLVKSKQGTVYGRMKQLSKDGRTIIMSLAISPMIDPSGEVTGILGIGLDVTEEARKAEEVVRLLHQLTRSRDILEMIYRSSMALTTTMDLGKLLEVVVGELNRGMMTEAAGILLHDENRGGFYWREIRDDKGQTALHGVTPRIPVDKSLISTVFLNGEAVVLTEPATQTALFHQFKTAFGLTVRNSMVAPFTRRDKTIGVLILINKKTGEFTEEDIHVCCSLAGMVSVAVENATFFEELLNSYRKLEDLNRVKSKILNHLSHELKTPLAIIHASAMLIEKQLKQMGIMDFNRSLERLHRHVESLNRLERQVQSIMTTGYAWERRMITKFLDSALAFMEVPAEQTPQIRQAADVIRRWVQQTFPSRQEKLERINLQQFAEVVFDYVRSEAGQQKRKVKLDFDIAGPAAVLIPEQVLHAVLEGLIKNAVEATPDGGVVAVTGRLDRGNYTVTVKDTGIGIPESEQELILEGFYPVQDTYSYSTGRPYSFNAGGKGIDLLRIKMFSELYGFAFSFHSRRCEYLVDALKRCPGGVARCPYCQSLDDCIGTFRTEFMVRFKLADDG